jgi:hypothetical protein
MPLRHLDHTRNTQESLEIKRQSHPRLHLNLAHVLSYRLQYFSTVTNKWKVHRNYFLATVVRIIDVWLIDGSD